MVESLIWVAALCGFVVGAVVSVSILMFVYGLYYPGRSKRDKD
jgi:hypothetical protein